MYKLTIPSRLGGSWHCFTHIWDAMAGLGRCGHEHSSRSSRSEGREAGKEDQYGITIKVWINTY